MEWDIGEEGFRVVLSREGPGMVRKHLACDVDEFLSDTGGPAVLQATEHAFDLKNGELDVSCECLQKTGITSVVMA